jgi:type I restriction enzyme R subunit
LQAMACVNRPYEDKEGRRKPAGFILDFVEIFEKLEDALAFDSDEVSGVVKWIDVLKKWFENLIEEGKESYLPIWAGLKGDKAIEAELEHFREVEKGEEFYKYFKELEEL